MSDTIHEIVEAPEERPSVHHHPAVDEHGDVTIALPFEALRRLIGDENIAAGVAKFEDWSQHFRGGPRPEDVAAWFEGFYGAAAATVITQVAGAVGAVRTAA